MSETESFGRRNLRMHSDAAHKGNSALAVEPLKVLVTGKLNEIALNLLRNPPAELSVGTPLEIVYEPDCSRDTLLREVASAKVLVTR